MPAKFEIFKDKKGEFWFRLKATNGEIIATGESYPTIAGCKKGIASIQRNAPEAPIVDTTAETAANKKSAAKVKTSTQKKFALKATAGAKPKGRKPKAE